MEGRPGDGASRDSGLSGVRRGSSSNPWQFVEDLIGCGMAAVARTSECAESDRVPVDDGCAKTKAPVQRAAAPSKRVLPEAESTAPL